jgi:hypothetical protein
MSEGYSPLQQTQTSINQDEKRAYGSPINTNDYSYFPITNWKSPLKYCRNTNVGLEDYLFVSLNGELENATLFGQAKNYEYQKSGPDYEVIVWKKAEDGTDNITNVPITQVNETYSHLPTFKDVGYPSDPLKFFVERPKNEAKTATCFQSVKKFFTGSGTKRRRKNKRKSSNKKMKQRKSSNKRRRTKKNKILPIMYGGASIKQYGIASALRSLIFTYFPQRGFDIINLPEDDSLNKYGLTNKYTTVMEVLNQIVHNDDGRAILPREVKFGHFLEYSQDLDNLLSDIISDIKQYFYQPKISNKISPKEVMEISGLINSIQDELVRTTGLRSEKELQANVAPANVAQANVAPANVAPANVAPANVAPKNKFLDMLLAASASLPKK